MRSGIEPRVEFWLGIGVRLFLLAAFLIVSAGFLSAQEKGRARAVPDLPGVPEPAGPGRPAVPDAPSFRPEQVADPVKMEPAFEPGKTYRFVTQTGVRMQLPGRGIRELFIEQQARFDATKRDDGKAGTALRARTERLKIDLRSGSQRISYDSLSEEDRKTRLGQHFRASLNRWVDLKLNKDFRIVHSEVGGRAGTAAPLPGVPQFGPDEMRKLVALIPQGLPDDKVRPGDEWVLKGGRDVGEVGGVTFDITYRFRGDTEHEGYACQEIELSGLLAGDVALPSTGGALSGGRMDFGGTSLRGRILFDPAEKTVRYSEQAISMLLELPGGVGEQPVQVPVEQKATLRLLHSVPTG